MLSQNFVSLLFTDELPILEEVFEIVHEQNSVTLPGVDVFVERVRVQFKFLVDENIFYSLLFTKAYAKTPEFFNRLFLSF